jgi:hypothetical protein
MRSFTPCSLNFHHRSTSIWTRSASGGFRLQLPSPLCEPRELDDVHDRLRVILALAFWPDFSSCASRETISRAWSSVETLMQPIVSVFQPCLFTPSKTANLLGIIYVLVLYQNKESSAAPGFPRKRAGKRATWQGRIARKQSAEYEDKEWMKDHGQGKDTANLHDPLHAEGRLNHRRCFKLVLGPGLESLVANTAAQPCMTALQGRRGPRRGTFIGWEG